MITQLLAYRLGRILLASVVGLGCVLSVGTVGAATVPLADAIKKMMRMAQPGDTHVDGSHLFSLYDWGRSEGFEGLIDAEGDRRLSDYAFRMGIRALQGGREVLLSSLSDSPLAAIATRSASSQLDLLMVNDQSIPYHIRLDASPIISILSSDPEANLWEFSETTLDAIVAHPRVDRGTVELTIPAQSAFLLQLMQN